MSDAGDRESWGTLNMAASIMKPLLPSWHPHWPQAGGWVEMMMFTWQNTFAVKSAQTFVLSLFSHYCSLMVRGTSPLYSGFPHMCSVSLSPESTNLIGLVMIPRDLREKNALVKQTSQPGFKPTTLWKQSISWWRWEHHFTMKITTPFHHGDDHTIVYINLSCGPM